MSYTYLITGATSDGGRALIERLLQNAPADTRSCWPRAAAIWKSWLTSAPASPVRCARSTWTCRTAPRSIPSCRCWRPPPRADAFHPPARAARCRTPNSRRSTRPALTAIWKFRSTAPCASAAPCCPPWPRPGLAVSVHPDELHHRLPAQEYRRLRHGQERHRRAGQEPGRRVCPLRRHGQLRRPQHDGNELPGRTRPISSCRPRRRKTPWAATQRPRTLYPPWRSCSPTRQASSPA